MKKISALLTAMLAVAILVSCNLPQSGAAEPTLGVTQAFQTVEARLTESAALTPSNTPQPTATNTVQTTATLSGPTATAKAPASATAPASQCDQAAAGNPIDVTIPDDTVMQPGQAFTKTWRLMNTGTCAWTKDYSIALFTGEPMGAITGVQLPYEVTPGQSVDVSAALIAPSTPGRYQGDWKLRNPKGTWFGLGPGGASSFWVRIVVGGTASGTPTLTTTPSTGTPTVTPVTPYPPGEQTATSAPQVSGSISMIPPSNINLDNGIMSTGGGDDLYYRLEDNGKLSLVPLNSARFAVVGSSQPSQSECKAAPLSSAILYLTNFNSGTVLCYITESGRYGRMRLATLDTASLALTIEFLTWGTP